MGIGRVAWLVGMAFDSCVAAAVRFGGLVRSLLIFAVATTGTSVAGRTAGTILRLFGGLIGAAVGFCARFIDRQGRVA